MALLFWRRRIFERSSPYIHVYCKKNLSLILAPIQPQCQWKNCCTQFRNVCIFKWFSVALLLFFSYFANSIYKCIFSCKTLNHYWSPTLVNLIPYYDPILSSRAMIRINQNLHNLNMLAYQCCKMLSVFFTCLNGHTIKHMTIVLIKEDF